MFGIGFFEILIILVVAVIFLGPEKLPQAIVDFVKFFRAVKKTINEAKDTLDKELEISKLSNEVSDIKSQFETNIDSITKDMDLSNLQEIKEITDEMQDLRRLPNIDNAGDNVVENMEDLEILDNKLGTLGTKENLFSEYSSLPQSIATKSNPKSIKLAKNTKKSPPKSPAKTSAKTNTKSSAKSTKSTKTIKSTKSITKSTKKTTKTTQAPKSSQTPKSTKPQKPTPNKKT